MTARPLRIVDVGNSISVLQVPAASDRSEVPYPELLPDALAARGIAAVCRNEGRMHDFVHLGLRRYERHVRVHAPDVVVLHYGVLEAQPWYGPLPLLRHVVRRHTSVTRTASWYRRHVVKRIWDALSSYRRHVAARLGFAYQVSPRRFHRGIEQLVQVLRSDLRPLVLILTIAPPPQLLEVNMPGQALRVARYNRMLVDVVEAAADPEVVLVDVGPLIDELGGAETTVIDGMHFTPALHRRLAEVLADTIAGRVSDGDAAAGPGSTTKVVA